jgi:hypothetical protein
MLSLWISLALAQDDLALAEYRQHHDELVKLAGKNRWDGVERHYAAMLALGVELSAEDHLAGAQAARAGGDVSAMLARLDALQALAPSDETQAWIDQIHGGWVQVQLSTVPATPGVELELRRKPFAADERAAIEHAQAQVLQHGGFTGWLPPGNYRFAGARLPLDAGDTPVELVQDMAWGGKKVR